MGRRKKAQPSAEETKNVEAPTPKPPAPLARAHEDKFVCETMRATLSARVCILRHTEKVGFQFKTAAYPICGACPLGKVHLVTLGMPKQDKK